MTSSCSFAAVKSRKEKKKRMFEKSGLIDHMFLTNINPFYPSLFIVIYFSKQNQNNISELLI